MPHAVITLIIAVLSFCSIAAAPAFAVGTEDESATAAPSPYEEAKATVDSGNYTAALPMLAGLTQNDPQNANAWNLLGFTNRKLGNMDDAAQAYAAALRINPDHRGALEYQGELYIQIGQPEKARANAARLNSLCGTCEEYEDLEAALKAAGV